MKPCFINKVLKPIALLALLFLPYVVLGATDRNDPAAGLSLEMHLKKDRVWPQEQLSVTVTLLADATMQIRNLQYPSISGSGFSVSEFDPPRQVTVTREGRTTTTYEFDAKVTPALSGNLAVGPAQLVCEVLIPTGGAADFFGESEPRAVTVRSAPASLTVLPLPQEGRPAGFHGAIGAFTISRNVSPSHIRSGDPVTATTTITGVGNIDTFSCPEFSLTGTTIHPPRAVRRPGSLTCEQVVLMEQPGIREIPGATISFFNPTPGRYQTRRTPVIPIMVTAPQMPPAAGIAPPVPRQTNAGPPRISTTPFLLGWLLAVAAGGLFLFRRLKYKDAPERPKAVPFDHQYLAYAERALINNDKDQFYLAVFRAAQTWAHYHSNRLAKNNAPAATVDQPSELPVLLLEIMDECDAVRYGLASREHQHMKDTFSKIKKLTIANLD